MQQPTRVELDDCHDIGVKLVLKTPNGFAASADGKLVGTAAESSFEAEVLAAIAKLAEPDEFWGANELHNLIFFHKTHHPDPDKVRLYIGFDKALNDQNNRPGETVLGCLLSGFQIAGYTVYQRMIVPSSQQANLRDSQRQQASLYTSTIGSHGDLKITSGVRGTDLHGQMNDTVDPVIVTDVPRLSSKKEVRFTELTGGDGFSTEAIHNESPKRERELNQAEQSIIDVAKQKAQEERERETLSPSKSFDAEKIMRQTCANLQAESCWSKFCKCCTETLPCAKFCNPEAEKDTFFDRHQYLHTVCVVILRFLGVCTAAACFLMGITAGFGLSIGTSQFESSDAEYFGGLMLLTACPVLLIESGSCLGCSRYIMSRFSWFTGFAHLAYESYYTRFKSQLWSTDCLGLRALFYVMFAIPAYPMIIPGVWLQMLCLNTTAAWCMFMHYAGHPNEQLGFEKDQMRSETMEAWALKNKNEQFKQLMENRKKIAAPAEHGDGDTDGVEMDTLRDNMVRDRSNSSKGIIDFEAFWEDLGAACETQIKWEQAKGYNENQTIEQWEQEKGNQVNQTIEQQPTVSNQGVRGGNANGDSSGTNNTGARPVGSGSGCEVVGSGVVIGRSRSETVGGSKGDSDSAPYIPIGAGNGAMDLHPQQNDCNSQPALAVGSGSGINVDGEDSQIDQDFFNDAVEQDAFSDLISERNQPTTKPKVQTDHRTRFLQAYSAEDKRDAFVGGTLKQKMQLIPGLDWGEDSALDAQIFYSSNAELRAAILDQLNKLVVLNKDSQDAPEEWEAYPWHYRPEDGSRGVPDDKVVVKVIDGAAPSNATYGMFDELYKLLGHLPAKTNRLSMSPGTLQTRAGVRAKFNLDHRMYTSMDSDKTAWMNSSIEYQRNIESGWLACFVFENEYLYLVDQKAESCARCICNALCCKCSSDGASITSEKQKEFLACRKTRQLFKDQFIQMQFDVQEFVTPNGKEVLALGAEMVQLELRVLQHLESTLVKGTEVMFKENSEDAWSQGAIDEVKTRDPNEAGFNGSVTNSEGNCVYTVRDATKRRKLYEGILPSNIREKRDQKEHEILNKLNNKDKIESIDKVQRWEPFQYNQRHNFRGCIHSSEAITDAQSQMNFTPAEKLKIVQKLIHHSHSNKIDPKTADLELSENQGHSKHRGAQVHKDIFSNDQDQDNSYLTPFVLLKDDYLNDVRSEIAQDEVEKTNRNSTKEPEHKNRIRVRISDFVFCSSDKNVAASDEVQLEAASSFTKQVSIHSKLHSGIPCPLAASVEEWVTAAFEELNRLYSRVTRRQNTMSSWEQKLKKQLMTVELQEAAEAVKVAKEALEAAAGDAGAVKAAEQVVDEAVVEQEKVVKQAAEQQDHSSERNMKDKIVANAKDMSKYCMQLGEVLIRRFGQQESDLILAFKQAPPAGFGKNFQAMFVACHQVMAALIELDASLIAGDWKADRLERLAGVEPEYTAEEQLDTRKDNFEKQLDKLKEKMKESDSVRKMKAVEKFKETMGEQRREMIGYVHAHLDVFKKELKATLCYDDELVCLVRPCESLSSVVGDNSAKPNQFIKSKSYKKPIFVKRDTTDKGLNAKISGAYDAGHLIRYFPMHDANHKRYLLEEWGAFKHTISALWNEQPLEDVVGYYGEEIGFYFNFLTTYTASLAFLTMLSLIMFVRQLQNSTKDQGLDKFDLEDWAPVYCGTLLLWAIYLHGTWYNEEKLLQIQWNMVGFETSDQAKMDHRSARPQYDPTKWSTFRLIMSYVIMITLITLDAVMIVGLLILRWWLTWATDYAWVSSALQGVVIVIVNLILKEVAILLTEFENHVTNTEFENHLIGKSFGLECINSYLILVITAFIKSNNEYFDVKDLIGDCTCPADEWNAPAYDCYPGTECKICIEEAYQDSNCKCNAPDCMLEIGSTMMTVFFTNLFISNVMEVMMPFICGKVRYYLGYLKGRKRNQDEEDEQDVKLDHAFVAQQQLDNGLRLLPAEIHEERHMHPYYDHHEGYFGVFDDMNEMAIQYGFIVMWSVSFPASCVLAFVNNVIELRTDANKLCRMTQRPWPQGSAGLNIWHTIFQALTVLGIIVNTLMLLWTSKFGERVPDEYKVIVFVAIEHGVILSYIIIAAAWGESPKLIMAQITLDKLNQGRNEDLASNTAFYSRDISSNYV